MHLLIWAAWREHAAHEVSVAPPEDVSAMEVDLLPPDEEVARAAQEQAPAALDTARATTGASESTRQHETSAQPSVAQTEPSALDTPPPTTERHEQVVEAPVAPTQAPGVGAVPGQQAVALQAQPSSTAAPLPAAPATTPATTPTTDRLAALGYGAPNAAALQPFLNVSPAALAEDRLNQHLAQATVDLDRDHSLGIEGPITTAVHTGAMGVVVPKSLSKIAITIGRDGKIADFRIIETNRDARALTALGERVKRLLANQIIRVPSGRPMEFIYEVKSEVLLPSGRAPGLAVEVAGIPVKKGRDEKSSKISILTPVLKFESQSLPDPDRNGKVTQTLPQLVYGISILAIGADAVDIAASERQVVHTRLIRQRVL